MVVGMRTVTAMGERLPTRSGFHPTRTGPEQRRESGVEGWAAVGPRGGGFELGGHTHQQVFTVRRGHQL